MITPRHSAGIVALGLVLAAILVALATDRYLLSGDPEFYVELAGALSHGEGYEFNGRPEAKYPPGFPLLLAPAALVVRNDFAIASGWAAFLAALLFPMTYWWAARQGSRFPLALAVATVTSMTFLQLATGNPMADPAFTAISLAFLLWADAWQAGAAPKTWRMALLGALLLTLAAAVRTAGIALIAAYALTVAFHTVRDRPGLRRFAQSVLPLLLSFVYFGVWSWWTTAMRRPWYSGEYMDSYPKQMMLVNPYQPELGPASIGDVLGRLLPGLRIQAAHAGELLTQIPWIEPVWYSPLVLLPILLVLAGLVQEIRRGKVLGPAYVTAYMGVIVLWPFDEGRRFLFPLLPLLFLFAARGVALILEAIRAGDVRTWRWLMALGAVCLMGALVGLARDPAALSAQKMASAVSWAGLLLGATVWGRRLLAAGIGTAVAAHPSRSVAALTLAFAAAGIAQAGPALLSQARGAAPVEPTAQALDQATRWLRQHTPASAVIQATFESRVHVASRRPAVPLPLTTSLDAFREIDRQYQPTHVVVVDPTEFPYYRPTDPERFAVLRTALAIDPVLVHRFPGGSIYALR